MPKKKSDHRPVNLQLWTMRFPITAIISILHRISGFILFLLLPLIIWAWQYTLTSSSNFVNFQNGFNSWYSKLFLWAIVSALIYHIIAGIRHLLMDMHFGDTKQAGKIGAYIVLILTLITSLMFGAYIW